jgi:hypothetical protein
LVQSSDGFFSILIIDAGSRTSSPERPDHQIQVKAAEADKYSKQWAASRWATMVSLIVFLALVAAEKTITAFFDPVPTWIMVVFAVLSIVVAIGTAYDQSAKPGTRWRLSAGYATKFRGLITQAKMCDPIDRDAITRLGKDFQELDQKWLDDTTV